MPSCAHIHIYVQRIQFVTNSTDVSSVQSEFNNTKRRAYNVSTGPVHCGVRYVYVTILYITRYVESIYFVVRLKHVEPVI